MKIFLTGHEGLLGKKFLSMLQGEHEVYTKDNLDIRDYDTFPDDDYDAFIHCAGKTDVDWCEMNKYDAWKVNVEGTMNVIRFCLEKKCKLIFISSDYVLKPINFYAMTKKVAEEEIRKIVPDFLLVRTSTLFGYNDKDDRKTFVTWVLGQTTDIKTVEDNKTHPTLIDDVVMNVEKLLLNGRRGTVTIVGADCVSKFELANKVISTFGLKIKNEKCLAKDVTSWIARRPFELRIINYERVKVHGIDDGLIELKRQMEESK